MKFVIGVDVGGTNIKLGLIAPKGGITARARLSTKTYKSKSKLIDGLAKAILDLIHEQGLRKKDILGVGIGVPGPVDVKNGVVRFLPNIPGWKNVPLKKQLEKKIHLRVVVENDVNMITLGEWKHGAGKKAAHLICITLGTGVGGGLIFNNQMYRGEGYAAGEIGHMLLPGQPQKGTKFVSFENCVGHRQLSRLGGKIYGKASMPVPELYARANKGEARALKFWKQAATLIGQGLVGVVTLLNPKYIVIGGGVANNFKYLKKPIEDVIRQHGMQTQASMVKVVKAKLGDDAGLVGARVLLKNATHA